MSVSDERTSGVPLRQRPHSLASISSFDNPVADAYETAQLMLIALAAADAVGMESAQSLLAMQKAQRWLGRR